MTATLNDLDEWAKARAAWRLHTLFDDPPRPNQITPDGDWFVWLVMAGRGFGKTRLGAEDVSEYARTHPNTRIAVVASTWADARDVCIEGESGLLSILPPSALQGGSRSKAWNSSEGVLRLSNGTRIDIYSAEKPDGLRGYQHHRAWCDEIAKWRYPETWDQLLLGLRLGDDPRVVATSTPKPVRLVRELVAREGMDVHITRGTIFENSKNLAPSAVAAFRRRYEGSRLGRQELYGELLTDFDGALWNRDMIDRYKMTPDEQGVMPPLPTLTRIGIGIDPSAWGPEAAKHEDLSEGEGTETGIIVAGITRDEHIYVLDDLSCRESPLVWARRAVEAFHEHKANGIVPETNMGNALVTDTIRGVDGNVPIYPVRASQGKRARAEPVAAMYEQGRVHHVGTHPILEEQMVNWDPTESYSPDRIDALVWVITWLAPWRNAAASTNRSALTRARIPTGRAF